MRGGQGIFISSISSDVDRISLIEKLNKCSDYIVEEVLSQHPAIAEFNSTSINSIRVNSVRDRKSGRIVIVDAVFRMGRKDAAVDNYNSGGIAAEDDVYTGIVISTAVDHFGNRYIMHPDSGKVISGFRIPSWESVLVTVEECHGKLDKSGYVGWDLSVRPDGKCSVIEANSSSGVGIQQAPGLSGKKFVYKQYL